MEENYKKYDLWYHPHVCTCVLEDKFKIEEISFEIRRYCMWDEHADDPDEQAYNYYVCFKDNNIDVPYFTNLKKCYQWAIDQFNEKNTLKSNVT